jgi:hypothetical protein
VSRNLTPSRREEVRVGWTKLQLFANIVILGGQKIVLLS